MKKYKITRNPALDFTRQKYGQDMYPNLHKYPATMIPQLGIELLKEFNCTTGELLDPYCGSGSSFAAALEVGIEKMDGFDLNPLAVLIAQTKFTLTDTDLLIDTRQKIRNKIYNFIKREEDPSIIPLPPFSNIDFWFSKQVIRDLAIIRFFIQKNVAKELQNIFWTVFSETVRDCSYTRANEFKLYRIKDDQLLLFNPNVIDIYFSKLDACIDFYKRYYYPKIARAKINIHNCAFVNSTKKYNVVLTSPPYGDSRTTVAYGQFSRLANEWLEFPEANRIDARLMGGKKCDSLLAEGVLREQLTEIDAIDHKRALEVSSFYHDLAQSIKYVGQAIKKSGKVIYVVGNRTVKNVQLATDQFVAEEFEKQGFVHCVTYERIISNKVMPARNSPTNKVGKTVSTMVQEYIVVCEKKKE